MEFINKVIDIFLHLDKNLNLIIQNYGILTYLFLFLIIFIETGLVIAPFLPGDSLLFVAGTFAAQGLLNVYILFIILSIAAILGDSLNYSIGKHFGAKLFKKENSIYFNKKYLNKTHDFYNKHGKKTIVLARFVPIIRTFAPFVAGIGKMNYFEFLTYNILGGILWVAIFVFGGYYFGNLPFVKNNFSLVIILIILLSLVPGIIEYFKHKKK